MITLLDHFTWNGSATSSFSTPWVGFPSDYKNAELWISTKLTDGNSLSVDLQSSPDTVQSEDASNQSVNSIGMTIASITSKLGPYVRLKLSTSGTAAAVMLSVWLIPKRD